MGIAMDPATGAAGSLLLVLPIPVCRRDNELWIESQAASGLEHWADNFSSVTCAFQLTDAIRADASGWRPQSTLRNGDRIRLHVLPTANTITKSLKAGHEARRQARTLIAHHKYLSFAIYGLFGDWSSLACAEAARMGRQYSVWTDVVGHERCWAQRGPGLIAAAKAGAHALAMQSYHAQLIAAADLGLFNGAETYGAYSSICKTPRLVNNIHLSASHQIDELSLRRKVDRIRSGAPLRVVYAGRAIGIKGPLDWLDALAEARKSGATFEAAWWGDGDALAAMKTRAEELRLSDTVSFPGFTADHDALMGVLRNAEVFLFCHKTRESPRCLIEALKSGAVLAGYDGAHVRSLVERYGGAVLVPKNDPAKLGMALAQLDRDREFLASLVAAAARSGEVYTEEMVFRVRSDYIKQYCG